MAKGLEGSSDDLTRTKKDKKITSELPKAAGYQRNWGVLPVDHSVRMMPASDQSLYVKYFFRDLSKSLGGESISLGVNSKF